MQVIVTAAKKLVRSTLHTIDGFTVIWKKEQSFRMEVYLCAIAIPVAVCLPVLSISKLILVILLLALLTTEIINSAIEAVVDRISTEIHPLSKMAKDMGSAAVGMVILMNIIAWIIIVASI